MLGNAAQRRHTILGPYLALWTAVFGCGDNIEPSVDEVLARLRALPHVHDAAKYTTTTAGVDYIVLHFAQPVDHSDPTSATFLQQVSLLHRTIAAPLIVHTSGYWDYYRDRQVELTQLLGGNQISIEHRYFGTSRPEPTDWTKLTIEQMAADQHIIVDELRSVYTGAALSTGGSKGGMTAVFHRRFFPDDVDGTVAYVAPISFGAPDGRYAHYLDAVGPPECRQAVRDAAIEMLHNRRVALEARAYLQAENTGYTYTRIALGPAVEAAIVELEWSFWQYFGVVNCTEVPAVNASDDAMFVFLNAVSPPSDNSDAQVGLFEAYYYQSQNQLGYPDGADYLMPFLKYGDVDYAAALPVAQPAYDQGAAMRDIDDFVRQHGERFVFVYGEWDPWTGGAFELGNATDSLRVVQRQGTHNASLTQLASADVDAALAKLAAWTHVTPNRSPQRAAFQARTLRVPPAWNRALRARRGPPFGATGQKLSYP